MISRLLERCLELFCIMERIQFANVQDPKVVLQQSDDTRTVTNREVEVDDAETVGEPIHQREQTWRERMNAGEGKHIQRFSVL